MAQLGLYLVLMILIWIVIAKVVFPDSGEKDPYAAFIAANGPLLTQVAENAQDPDAWPGIRETDKVRSVLQTGGIQQVRPGEDGSVAFWMGVQDSMDLRYVYSSDGSWPLPEKISGEDWTEVEAQREDVRHWVGGLGGLQNASARRLSDRFFLMQMETE